MHPLVTALLIAQAVAVIVFLIVLDRRVKHIDDGVAAYVNMAETAASSNVSTTGAQRVMRRAQ